MMGSICSNWLCNSTVRLLLTVAIGAVTYFLWKLYNARLVFYRLQKQGMPMPPWNPIFGHLAIMPQYLKQIPTGASQPYMLGMISKDFPKSDYLYYLDLWPFSGPMIVISTPDLAFQMVQEQDLQKPKSLIPFFKPITGGVGIAVMNGEELKASRALFNPGFASNVILEQTGAIVEEAKVFVELLRGHVEKGDIFSLDELTCWYMMDVIGKVTLDARFKSLTTDNPLASAMRQQLDTHVRDEQLNPFIRFNPWRFVREWRNSHTMDNYISAELDKRYKEWQSASAVRKAKSVIDLALADYMQGREAKERLDPQFKAWACAQIRLFLFVGHDSTAATIVYSLYLLSKHPEAMERMRTEHDKVFGSDIRGTSQMLKDKPHLSNQLSYTTAVIKEALRLFPPAATFRGGTPKAYLRDPKTNVQYPTDGLGCLILHDALHRHPDHWPQPNEFLPERWLVEPGHVLYPPKHAWRPFEYGSRNCIGQTLVMLDCKVALVMVAREFDIKDAYKEWDRVNGTKGVKTVAGERAYQVSKGSMHPADGFPCRVFPRKR